MLKFEEAELDKASGAAPVTSALIVPPTSEPAFSIWLTSWPVTDGALFTFVSTFTVVKGAFATETVPPSETPARLHLPQMSGPQPPLFYKAQ